MRTRDLSTPLFHFAIAIRALIRAKFKKRGSRTLSDNVKYFLCKFECNYRAFVFVKRYYWVDVFKLDGAIPKLPSVPSASGPLAPLTHSLPPVI